MILWNKNCNLPDKDFVLLREETSEESQTSQARNLF